VPWPGILHVLLAALLMLPNPTLAVDPTAQKGWGKKTIKLKPNRKTS